MNELIPIAELIKLSEQQTNILRQLELINDQTESNSIEIQKIKDDTPIHPAINSKLTKLRKKKVMQFIGGSKSKAYNYVEIDEEGTRHRFSQQVFKEIEVDFKEAFNISSYAELPKAKLQDAIDYIESWEPSTNTKRKINLINNQLSFALTN